ncbi:hypothetical protein EW146_g2412 [Bondarzewia mesenterica]|uniref:Uncharacterized protein n=1 Tax=Bondarzewia mesenterica TaxID=1095465 RepID=A0A4S4M0N2_9AGAM|nr:hypothetical protein EW146_g2412 [Bondarzewia mesenterica]
MPIPQTTGSNLPANAPVFQPGVAAFPPTANDPPRHRKAASFGASSLSGNFNTYSPHLGAMMEDVEEVYGNAPYEEVSQHLISPLLLLSRNKWIYSAPRVALNSRFGVHRRPAANSPIEPSISEEDIGFQFPQQQSLQTYSEQEASHRKGESNGEIRGIIAEQIAIQNEIEALQHQQQALYQQPFASNQVLSFQTTGLAPNRAGAHRRVHSTVPMGTSAGGLGGLGGQQGLMSQLGLGNVSLGLDGQGERESFLPCIAAAHSQQVKGCAWT